ncbi:MAG TPA: glycosyltransferase [Pyrinomonadaceae bacterium]|nr:glycosyltransferase [Pyrinomonadaceae bacterium]
MSTAKDQTREQLDPRHVWAARRLWFKQRVYESRPLQSVYASWIDLQARVALWRGQPYEASRKMLRVWRHLGAEGVGRRRVDRLMRVVREHCYREGRLLPAAENHLRLDFIRSAAARELRKLYGSFPIEHRVRLRHPRPDPDPERQGDLIVLKPYDAETGERGVLMVMYSEGIGALAAVYDLAALASRYTLVLETSGWGYQDVRFFLYLGSDLDVLVQSPRREDFDFVRRLDTNLVPVRVGSGEWVDPSIFQPRAAGKEPEFDLVMVASWDPLKRHELLFRALAELKRERGRGLRFALIGYAMGWPRVRIEELLRRYGLESDCTIFEKIPHAEVARVVADSKVSLLLSRQEGSNRSVYESMFCATPVIIYRHHRGINLEHVNARTGLPADDDELAGAIASVVDDPARFDPRGWALEHIGYENATKIINEALSEQAARRGLPWTRDIVAKKNAPNLRYSEPGLYKRFAAEYERLQDFLLPLDD